MIALLIKLTNWYNHL